MSNKKILIADNIKHLRRLHNFSQEGLGAKIGKTKGAISTYEKGGAYPSVEAIVAIAKLFHVKIDDLLLSDLTKEIHTLHSAPSKTAGLSKEDELRLRLEMMGTENSLLRRQLEDLLKDKELNQEQIRKLWNLIEEYKGKGK